MRLNLSLQQRVALAFLVMILQVLFSRGAGLLYTNSLRGSIDTANDSIKQIQHINGLQLSWLEVVATLDNMLLTRQTGLVEQKLRSQMDTFNQQLKETQIVILKSSGGEIDENQKYVDSLLVLGEELTGTVGEILRAAGGGRWSRAQYIRHTEMASLQSRLRENLDLFDQALQAEVASALARAANSQRSSQIYWIISSVGALVVGVVLGVLTVRSITQPMKKLIAQVTRVTQKDFSPVQPLYQRDEIGDLSRAFSLMTDWLRESYETLEERVAERTSKLERRTVQVQVAAEIARDATAVRDLNHLLDSAINLIRSRFGFYHSGIFLLDEAGEYAVLEAATGEAGREMLARNHKLKVGEVGIVGFAAGSGLPRIALDVGEDAVHFKNPFLPDTRSEMALPLVVGERVIGVLDVQSEQVSAFNDDDIRVLQILADQIAVAIENARLLDQVQESLKEVETLYSQYSHEAWERVRRTKTVNGFQYDGSNVLPIPAWHVNEGHGNAAQQPAICIPLESRGESIGVLEVWPVEERFSTDEIEFLEAVGQRLSQAMETARLYQEAQNRAERERLAGQIFTKIRASNDPQEILQSAVQELRNALNVDRAQILLRSKDY
jgi:GAF domain-containing protein